MHEELVKAINQKVPEAKAQWEKREAGDSVVFVEPAALLKVCHFLKDDARFEFNVLQVITGCDYPPEKIEVSYVLASLNKNLELILKVKLPRNNPKVPSVNEVWLAADFQERECFDMVGVDFTGHPDFRRILCPEDWEGFPLRKDYVAAKSYRGMEIYPADKMNFPEREFAEKQKLALRAAKGAAAGAGDETGSAEET